MKTMTNLSLACKAFGWAGGTIHQVADELGIPGKGNHLALMPVDEFSKLLRKETDSRVAAERASILEKSRH
ncbi:hypothetical protein [Azotobacter beijerinckii]|uniref:hypothetical protein n=1 Tax=Azotobacter beijerinckii TaxID=170623 RepID=UPI0011605B4B|nr:hypothetical protein [Azotobacter beijerinckii]